jgi:hypothetical protein
MATMTMATTTRTVVMVVLVVVIAQMDKRTASIAMLQRWDH